MNSNPPEQAEQSQPQTDAGPEEEAMVHAQQNDARMRRYYFDNYLVLILGGAVLIWLITWLIDNYSLSEHMFLPQAPLREEPSLPQPATVSAPAPAAATVMAPAVTARMQSPPAASVQPPTTVPAVEKPAAPSLTSATGPARPAQPTAEDVRRQAEAFMKQGEAHTRAEQWKEAKKAYEQALALRVELAQTYSGSHSLQEDVLHTYLQLGDLLVAEGAPEQAVERYQEGLEFAKELYRQAPADSHLRDYLAEVHLRLAKLYRKQAANDEAIRAYRAFTDLLRDDNSLENMRKTAAAYDVLGDLYKQRDERKSAAWAYHSAFELYRRLARRAPDKQARQRVDYSRYKWYTVWQ